MIKARLAPLYFTEANDRERTEFREQLERLRGFYGDIAEFLPETAVGRPLPPGADAVLFPQLIFTAFRHDGELCGYKLPMVVLTSRYGTVEMWDWEIVTYLRDLGLSVFSPYSLEMGKTTLRGLGVRRSLQEGLLEVGSDAFSFCQDLARVSISSTVRRIDYSAFTGSGITAFEVADGNLFYEQKNGVLFEMAGAMLHTYPHGRPNARYKVPAGTKKLGDMSFRGCALESVTLPKSLEEIGVWVFSYSGNLRLLAIPQKVRAIGYGAFEGSAVSEITVADGNAVYEAANGALYDKGRKMLHTALLKPGQTRFEIAAGTLEVSACAFGQLKQLEEVVIPDTVTAIRSWAFRYTGLKTVTIPESVIELDGSVFYSCGQLTEVTLPAKLDRIAPSVFCACGSLEKVNIPQRVKGIGDYAFYQCGMLKNVVIPKGVAEIGPRAFFGCGSLLDLDVPASVTAIGDSAFAECGMLVLRVIKDSFAHAYAVQNNIPFKIKEQ